MRKTTNIITVFTFVILGTWFLQDSFSRSVHLSALNNDTQFNTSATSEWLTQTVATEMGGIRVNLAFDTHGYPHLVHQAEISFTNPIRYAHWTGIDWQTETIRSGELPSPTGASMDLNGDVAHFSYTTADNKLMFAFSGGISDTVDVGIGSEQVRDSSIAVGSNGLSHIVYRETEGLITHMDYIKYAYEQPGSTWVIDVVDLANLIVSDHFSPPSLVLDQNNDPHISYTNLDNDLVYAHISGGSWVTETVDLIGGGTSFSMPSMSVDSTGGLHICYIDTENFLLKYAFGNSLNWTVSVVDDAGSNVCSLAVDTNDHVHIAYIPISSGLNYAYWDGGTWQTKVVDIDISSPYFSLSLDKDNAPWIAYRAQSGHVALATKPGPVSMLIGVEGGVFTPTTNITVTFPSGAFSEPVTVTYTTVNPVAHTLTDIGVFYELTAVSTTTGQPAQLEPGETFTTLVQYDEANLPAGVSEDSLRLYYQTAAGAVQRPNAVSATWEPASSSVVDTESNEITAVDNHLGTWAVFGSNATGYELFLPAVIKP